MDEQARDIVIARAWFLQKLGLVPQSTLDLLNSEEPKSFGFLGILLVPGNVVPLNFYVWFLGAVLNAR